MKGDPRVAAKCPLCPHIVRPMQRRKEVGYVATTRALLRNAMKQHFLYAHPEMSSREMTETLDRICDATATMQTQIAGPSPGPTMFMQCPVPGCERVLQTWLEDAQGHGQHTSSHFTAVKALRQHIYHKHPGFSSRQVLEFLEFAVWQPVETKTEPVRPPQGPSAGGPTLPDLVAPARPAEPAHATGKVEMPRVLPRNKTSATVVVLATTS